MEEELKVKSEIIKNQEKLIQGWRKDLTDQLEKHNTELERVQLISSKDVLISMVILFEIGLSQGLAFLPVMLLLGSGSIFFACVTVESTIN